MFIICGIWSNDDSLCMLQELFYNNNDDNNM